MPRVMLLALVVAAALTAGEALPPLEPGAVLSFVPAGATDPVDARVARLIAVHVPAGEAPSPFVAPGRFTAVFDAVVTMDVWEQVVLTVAGAGSATVTVNGKEALVDQGPALAVVAAPIRFKTGRNVVQVRYVAPESGAAEFRLMWQSAKKPDRKEAIPPLEPIPPTVIGHDPAAAPALLAAASERRAGLAALGELRCAKCHLPGDPGAAPMPELAMDAPRLVDAGARLQAAWMAAWIRDPRALRPTARMPRIPHGATADQDAADMAAALAGMAPAPAAPPAVDEPTTQAGGRLYARLGCMGCHESGSPADVPLDRTAAKWHAAALQDFLLKPSAHYAWNPMPDFKLSETEAAAIAAYLRARFTIAAPEVKATGDAARGAQLLATSGCFNCHVQAGVAPAPTLADVAKQPTGGCLADDEAGRGKAPDYALDPQRRAALRAFLAGGLESLARRCPDEFAQRRIASLRCDACHHRDAADSAWSRLAETRKTLLATFTKAPEEPAATMYADLPPPRLTWTGDKLRPEWMAAFIAGQGPRAVRPWLRLRMPAFPAAADALAQGLAMQHGWAPETAEDPAADPAAATAGEQLLFGQNAFICNQCHDVGAGKKATQVFEHPGPDLAAAPARLRHAYYLRWMRNPPRIEDVGMPKFSDDDGKTAFTDVLGGDAAAQYEAIWAYLRTRPAK